ncbi:MAG: hypothetical protein M1831_000456 [Alyxoria varia]|nr:MAG: hypothetical protein M1831_000456 [Alyxoria varia]
MAQRPNYRTSLPPLQDPPPNTWPAALLWLQKQYQSIQKLWNYVTSVNTKVESIDRETKQNTRSINELRAQNDSGSALADLERHCNARFADLEKEIERLSAAKAEVQDEIERFHAVNAKREKEQDEEQRRIKDDFENLKNSMVHHDDTNDRLKDNENDVSNLWHEFETFKREVLSRSTKDHAGAGAISNHLASTTDSNSRVTSQSLQRASMGLGYNEQKSPSGQCLSAPVGSVMDEESPALQPALSIYRWKVRCGRDVEDTPDLVDDLAPEANPVCGNGALHPQDVDTESQGLTIEYESIEQQTPQLIGTRESMRVEPSVLDFSPAKINTSNAHDTSASGHDISEERPQPSEQGGAGRTEAKSRQGPVNSKKLQQSQRRRQLPPRKTRNSRLKESQIISDSPSPLLQLGRNLKPEPQPGPAVPPPPPPPPPPQVIADSQDEQHTLYQNASQLEGNQRLCKDAPPKRNYVSNHASCVPAHMVRKNPSRAAKILQTIEKPQDYVPAKSRKKGNERIPGTEPATDVAYGSNRQGDNATTAARSLIVKLRVPSLGINEVLGNVSNPKSATNKRKGVDENEGPAPRKAKRRGRPPGRKSKTTA